MLAEYIIIDDYFHNPQKIVEDAKSHEYDTNHNIHFAWSGMRTFELLKNDIDKYSVRVNELIHKGIQNSYGNTENEYQLDYSWEAHMYYHKYAANDWQFPHDPAVLHKDDGQVYAGVVYLNEEHTDGTGGTWILPERDKEMKYIENKFNRLVLYRGHIKHSPDSGFGEHEDGTSRLTMNFFINSLGIRIRGS